VKLKILYCTKEKATGSLIGFATCEEGFGYLASASAALTRKDDLGLEIVTKRCQQIMFASDDFAKSKGHDDFEAFVKSLIKQKSDLETLEKELEKATVVNK
jgi:hypothetical protein